MIVVEEEKQNKFKDKKVLVIGLARSGTGAANLLSGLGARVAVTDNKSRSALEAQIAKLSPSVEIITDGPPLDVFDDAELIVISPGVPLNIAPLVYAKEKGVPIIGELELAYQAVRSDESGVMNTETELAFIGVTGTNGKSTTTTLIDLMLKESGLSSLSGGNIGNALTEEILNMQQTYRGERLFVPANIEYIVAEISSFQLETVSEFKPKIAVILNITPDHLDRYDSLDEYIAAKARIFENQSSDDYLVLNADDQRTMELYDSKFKIQNSRLPKVRFFSLEKEVEGIYLRDGLIHCNLHTSGLRKGVLPYAPAKLELIKADDIRIQGVHNLENAMAASLVALIAGSSYDAVRAVLKNFPGLEHRLEHVDEINGVTFINDSKGTNVGAVVKSLESFDNATLIMGGTDKGGDFTTLREIVKRKVKHLILLGEAKEKIARELGELTETFKVSDLEEAVKVSMSKASPGDVVLLSPGCASFDMFDNFEQRGNTFKELVHKIGKRV